jgi:MFS family permease
MVVSISPSSSPVRIHPASLVWLAGVVAALHIGKLPPAIPVLRDALGVSLVQAGFLLSTVQVAGMLMGVFLGLATDSVGLRRSVLLGLLILGVASLAGAWAHSPGMLMALRAAEGVGVLLTVLPAPSLIRRLVAPQRLAARLGGWGAYMPTGTSAAMLVGPLVMGALGWPGWWGALGGVSLAVAVWVWAAVPADPVRVPVAAASGSTTAAVRDADTPAARLALTLRHRGPWWVALCFALYSSQWLAVVGFLPEVYAQAGVAGAQAGWMTALVSAVNIVGNVAAGRWLQRGVAPVRLLAVGFVCMALTTLLAFAPFTAPWPWGRYGAVLLFSSVGGLVPGTLFSLAVRVAPSERTVATTVGWVQQCSSTGQFLGPPLVAWVASQVGGWHWTWAVTGAASVVGLGVVWRLGLLLTKPQNA